MKMSQLFTRTHKHAPADEKAKNAQLLLRAGYVHKEMAGVYAYLPLGVRVLENIKRVIREEMNALDGQELLMTNLQPRATWEKTGRWSDDAVDVWFKSRLKDETEIGFGWTHEEPMMQMFAQHIKSYKHLPVSAYQFQTKLRNELRAKSGIMRGREFVMKDMYSLHASAEDLDAYYQQVIQGYTRVFDRLGIGDETYVTFASGGAFTQFSHEFQTICDAGEDVLYVHREKNIAVNEEVLDQAVQELGIEKDELEKVVSAEVGNIFNFGTDKAEQMGITYTSEDGVEKPLYLASYGIGVTRVMGVIVEKMSDDKGLVWSPEIAPARLHIVQIGDKGREAADALYAECRARRIEVLYDDRNERPGVKFADADLIGVPTRVTVSDRGIEAGAYEVTDRATGEQKSLTVDELFDSIN